MANLELTRANFFQSAILARHETISTHGLSKVMQPLIDDLKILETESTIEISGGTIKLRGSICLIIADNFGAHEMIGFFLFVSAFKFCNNSRNIKIKFLKNLLLNWRRN